MRIFSYIRVTPKSTFMCTVSLTLGIGGEPWNANLQYVAPSSLTLNVNPEGECRGVKDVISFTSSHGNNSFTGGIRGAGGFRGNVVLTRRDGGVVESTWMVGIGRNFRFRYLFFFPCLMYLLSKCKRHNRECLEQTQSFRFTKRIHACLSSSFVGNSATLPFSLFGWLVLHWRMQHLQPMEKQKGSKQKSVNVENGKKFVQNHRSRKYSRKGCRKRRMMPCRKNRIKRRRNSRTNKFATNITEVLNILQAPRFQ